MSNYPPGVTGNEYAIAGPDSEEDAVEMCDLTDEEEEGWVYSLGSLVCVYAT